MSAYLVWTGVSHRRCNPIFRSTTRGPKYRGTTMNILICGAGFTCEALLKRFGSAWRTTLIDKDADRLNLLSRQYETIARVIPGDASSPVVLEESVLADHDYVLALTYDDRVNLAVARFAREAGKMHIMALVYQAENLPQFEELEVNTIHVTGAVSSTIFHYLQDPRIIVTPVAQGRADLLEVEIGPQLQPIGRLFESTPDANWRVVGLLRKNLLSDYSPQTELQRGDRLLILGQTDVFRQVCDLIGCDEPHFPRFYGNFLALAIPGDQPDRGESLFKEGLYLVRNSKLQQMVAFCGQSASADLGRQMGSPRQLPLEVVETEGHLLTAVHRRCEETNVGIVMVPLLEKAFFDTLTKPLHISLAHSLPCPLMVARNTFPYDRILVPFNGAASSITALEAALDLASQIDAQVTAVVVEEPDFLHSTTEKATWAKSLLNQVRRLALPYKRTVEEVIKTGNPVTELTAMSKAFNLIVIGSTTEEKEFLEPHVGELLVRKSGCSILILTN